MLHQGHTEAGAWWSLPSPAGVTSPPRASRVTHVCPWKPRGPLSSWSPVSWALDGRGGKVPVSNQVSRSELLQEGTAQLNSPPTPRILCSPAHPLLFFFFPCRILGAHFLALGPFSIIWGLGNKAWPLSTQSDPAWRGRAGTTSFSTSRSVESRLTLGQASPVESPAGDPTPSHTSLLPQGGSRCPPLPPSQAPHGAGPVPCGRRVGMALGHPCPSPAESSICLCLGRGGGGFPVWLSLPGGHGTERTGSHGLHGVSPSKPVSCHPSLMLSCTFRSPARSPAWCWYRLPLSPPPHSWETRIWTGHEKHSGHRSSVPPFIETQQTPFSTMSNPENPHQET